MITTMNPTDDTDTVAAPQGTTLETTSFSDAQLRQNLQSMQQAERAERDRRAELERRRELARLD